jgi:hypothetical protein
MESNHGTLTAATVKAETFTVSNADVIFVHFVSGTGPIYFTVDGSTPSVGGAGTFVVYSGMSSRAVRINTSDAQTVKLIATGTPGYSVEVI